VKVLDAGETSKKKVIVLGRGMGEKGLAGDGTELLPPEWAKEKADPQRFRRQKEIAMLDWGSGKSGNVREGRLGTSRH